MGPLQLGSSQVELYGDMGFDPQLLNGYAKKLTKTCKVTLQS